MVRERRGRHWWTETVPVPVWFLVLLIGLGTYYWGAAVGLWP